MTNQLCRNVIEAKQFFTNNRDFKTLVLGKKVKNNKPRRDKQCHLWLYSNKICHKTSLT